MMEGGLDRFRGNGSAPAALTNPDPQRAFRTPSQIETVEGIVSDVLAGRAVVAVRGERGVGKTTQMRVVASKLGMRQRIVVMAGAGSVSPGKVLRLIAEAMGIAGAGDLASDRLLELVQGHRRTERLVLLIDDVQDLSPAMFRYLGLLVELFDVRPVRLQLVLFGPPGVWPGVEGPDLELMRQATFSRHFIHAAVAPVPAVLERDVPRAARFDPALRGPQGKWRQRASVAALCVLFVAGATVTFLVNQAETPARPPLRAIERQPVVPATVVLPPVRPAEPPAPAPSAEVQEAMVVPRTPLPPSPPVQTLPAPEQPTRFEGNFSPPRRGGPGLVLVAGAGDDLPNLYARVYRGLEPPPYLQVVAANRAPVRPGSLVVFPEPPAGWPSR